ncbi:MAG: trypsin-like peptidase domain-containing protein [Planctomycetes bacterium]|nr:trypsin-like peptidase domain-containing protein [Planctomycetota bacterium]MBL6911261.1 trypsin-like peptidase domain-containing protein [Pirellulales bacterium]HAO71636.1 serine protease [Planctomycetaceae bacterium]HAU48171.1 serine protease [Planctomycetaceae bacterium]|tara:strand:+ start:257 stop:1564 length:1308 start_codon:yes stop_codon:yes gene_type:complete
MLYSRVRLLLATILAFAACHSVAPAEDLRRTAIVRAIESCRDSVVNIHGEKYVSDSSDESEDRRVNGMGTGVVIDARGYAVTNFHVVDGVHEIEVTLASGRTVAARLISHDRRTDLAVIKIDTVEPLPVIQLGTSDDLLIGETVLALGNAFGYEHTVTRGIISALHRDVDVSPTQRYEDLIQTDASINPGNSGGPLLNINGEMIGINVAVRAGAQGIGFAIPVDSVLRIVTGLLSIERIDHTWHGLVCKTCGTGALIESVHSQSPAETIGMRAGDIILRVGDRSVTSQLDIERAFLGRKAGEIVAVTVTREGGEENLSLALAKARKQKASASERSWEQLGLRLASAVPSTVQQLQPRYRGGLLVQEVRFGSPASDKGIRPGDILVGLHIWETVKPDNVSYILDQIESDELETVKFYILRGRDTLFGHLTSDTILR